MEIKLSSARTGFLAVEFHLFMVKLNLKAIFWLSLDDGWPLGLQLMNARNLELELRSSSFSSLFTSTSKSTSFSSQSTRTYSYDRRRRRGVTLQSLLNTPTTINISTATSSSSSSPEPEIGGLRKSHVTYSKPKSWLHSLCSKHAIHDSSADVDATSTMTAHLSLGYLIEQERVMSSSGSS